MKKGRTERNDQTNSQARRACAWRKPASPVKNLVLYPAQPGVLEMQLLLDVTENEALLALSDTDTLQKMVDVAKGRLGCLMRRAGYVCHVGVIRGWCRARDTTSGTSGWWGLWSGNGVGWWHI